MYLKLVFLTETFSLGAIKEYGRYELVSSTLPVVKHLPYNKIANCLSYEYDISYDKSIQSFYFECEEKFALAFSKKFKLFPQPLNFRIDLTNEMDKLIKAKITNFIRKTDQALEAKFKSLQKHHGFLAMWKAALEKKIPDIPAEIMDEILSYVKPK